MSWSHAYVGAQRVYGQPGTENYGHVPVFDRNGQLRN